MSIKHEFILRDINYWRTKTITRNALVYDIISINIGKQFLDIPIYFARTKNFCYNDLLNDYTVVYTLNIGYVKELEFLQSRIPYLKSDPYISLTKEDIYEYDDE